MRIPKKLDITQIQECFRQLWSEMDKLTTTDFDFKGHRLINVGKATGQNDVVTLSQVPGAAAAGAKPPVIKIPACCVRNSANQAITNAGTFTALTFDTEVLDTAQMHSTSTNTNRITFTVAGLYAYGGSMKFAAGTEAGPCVEQAQILLNNTTIIAGANQQMRAQILSMHVSGLREFVANDYIEFKVQHDFTSARNSLFVANSLPMFWAYMIPEKVST